MFNLTHMEAYANSALDGYNVGNENNLYTADDLHVAYRWGYDYGVALYCNDNHSEKE